MRATRLDKAVEDATTVEEIVEMYKSQLKNCGIGLEVTGFSRITYFNDESNLLIR